VEVVIAGNTAAKLKRTIDNNMKRIIYLLVSIAILSCSTTKQLTLKGNYLAEPFTFTSPKSKQQVWDNVVSIVAQTGMKFSRLDKDNGLLVSEEYSFAGAITTEDINGNLLDTSAWIVVNSKYWKVTKEYEHPKAITGVLTVHLKESSGGTLGNINLTNLKVYNTATGLPVPADRYVVRSTGVFERKLADKLK